MHICFANFDTATVALLDPMRQRLGCQELSECGMCRTPSKHHCDCSKLHHGHRLGQ